MHIKKLTLNILNTDCSDQHMDMVKIDMHCNTNAPNTFAETVNILCVTEGQFPHTSQKTLRMISSTFGTCKFSLTCINYKISVPHKYGKYGNFTFC